MHSAGAGGALELEEARIYWEYNSTDDDLGVHVFLDGEDWTFLKIKRPDHKTIFEVRGKGPYAQLGLTELFFEGAEPELSKVPLQELLAKFPEGTYSFRGLTVDDEIIEGEAEFSHAIPAGPQISFQTGPNNFLKIQWTSVSSPPPGFPNEPIAIVAYQVLIGEEFDITLPATANSVTVPPEFVTALGPGSHSYEVLAIDQSHNQTITEGHLTL
jgi:hypothetical protein